MRVLSVVIEEVVGAGGGQASRRGRLLFVIMTDRNRHGRNHSIRLLFVRDGTGERERCPPIVTIL